MNNFNYFFTPVGPEYKKKFARNVGVVVLILFAFYGVTSLIGNVSEPKETEMIDDVALTIPTAEEFLSMDCEKLDHIFPEFPNEEVADAWITRMHECLDDDLYKPNLTPNVFSNDKTIQTIIDYCTHKLQLSLGEIPMKNPDGSYNVLLNYPLIFENQTHYMDNSNCQLVQTWDGYSHPFGYEYEPKVIFSINTLEE